MKIATSIVLALFMGILGGLLHPSCPYVCGWFLWSAVSPLLWWVNCTTVELMLSLFRPVYCNHVQCVVLFTGHIYCFAMFTGTTCVVLYCLLLGIHCCELFTVWYSLLCTVHW